MKVAIHMHSKSSDGQLTREEITKRAQEEGVRILAITDHDYVPPKKEVAANSPDGMLVLNAAEFSADDLSNFHILAYNIRCPEYLNALYEFLNNTNRPKYCKLIENLVRSGVDISYEQVQEFAGKRKIDKAIIKKFLVSRKYATSTKDAHERYIGKLTGNYVKTRDFNASLIVEAIRACGGMPVLAHPSKIKKPDGTFVTQDDLAHIVDYLTPFGLQGIEVSNSKNDSQNVEFLSGLAEQHGLVKMEGLDFHDPQDQFELEPEHMETEKFLECIKKNQAEYDISNVRQFHREQVKPIIDTHEKTINESKIEQGLTL